jgi:hypothetical protein
VTARQGRVHFPVTSILFGEQKTARVHFHCPCGVTEQLTICDVDVCPPLRFTAALRAQHEAGAWPPVVEDLGDASDAGWGAAKEPAA